MSGNEPEGPGDVGARDVTILRRTQQVLGGVGNISRAGGPRPPGWHNGSSDDQVSWFGEQT